MSGGSYGRYGLLLVPVWLVAAAVLIDQARRLGGAVALVAGVGGAIVALALAAFAWMRWGTGDDDP